MNEAAPDDHLRGLVLVRLLGLRVGRSSNEENDHHWSFVAYVDAPVQSVGVVGFLQFLRGYLRQNLLEQVRLMLSVHIGHVLEGTIKIRLGLLLDVVEVEQIGLMSGLVLAQQVYQAQHRLVRVYLRQVSFKLP